ncbi:Mediator of DNA damage checkpoint protein 1 [Coemansia sp. RSA 1646]|nr:Mediator of DNA damage checkpoint protein 1 [Coemansia sp. RSA 1646]
MAPRLNSGGCSAKKKLETVTLSGFVGEDRDKATHAIEAHGLQVTENPLMADICIRHGRLGRTLKVLCAMARGTPIVSDSWAHQLENHAPDAPSEKYADLHLVSDQATEREWNVALRETLCRARRARESEKGLLSLYCVHIADDVARPDPVCLAIMVRAAGGHVLNDFGMREQRLLEEGESSMHWVLHVSRRLTDSNPDHHQSSTTSGWKPMPIDTDAHKDIIDGLSASSSEPDDDNDEDWSIEKDRTRVGTRSSSSSNKRRQKNIKSEPSVIFAPPPTSPTTPLFRNNSEGLAMAPPPSSASSVGKRRRIEKSPSISSGSAMMDYNQQLATTVSSFLDPNCSLNDMQVLLAARKAELNIPANSQLLVVTTDVQQQQSSVSKKKAWERHGAMVVEPELIIQSIIQCDRKF